MEDLARLRGQEQDVEVNQDVEEEKQEEEQEKQEPNDGLCEYERIRLANIRQREKLFAELEFGEAKQGLGQGGAGGTKSEPSR